MRRTVATGQTFGERGLCIVAVQFGLCVDSEDRSLRRVEM
jgi:hypothetical protein